MMPKRLRTLLFSMLTLAVVLAVLEVGASWLLLLHYRSAQVANFAAEDPSWFTLVNLARRAGQLAGWSGPPATCEETDPSPFFRPDPVLGYSAAPGRYTHTFSRRNGFTGAWESFRIAGSRVQGNVEAHLIFCLLMATAIRLADHDPHVAQEARAAW